MIWREVARQSPAQNGRTLPTISVVLHWKKKQNFQLMKLVHHDHVNLL